MSDQTIPSPKEDFYFHVNKKWIDDPVNAIPAEYSSWGGFVKLHDESLKNQISLLEEIQSKSKEDCSSDEYKMALIWKASIQKFEEWDKETSDDASNSELYFPITTEFGKLKEIFINGDGDLVDRMASYFSYATKYNIPLPLDFDKGGDLTSSMDIILDLSPSGRSLPSRDYYFEDSFQSQRESFKKHLQNIENLMKNANISLESDFVEKVFSFEKDLAYIGMKQDQSREYSEYYTNTSLRGFINEIDTLNYLSDKLNNYPEDDRNVSNYSEEEKETLSRFFEKIYSDLDLRRIMKENYEKEYSEPADESRIEKIAVFDGDYFRRVFRLLFNPENESRLIAYLQYKIINFSQAYCTKALNEEIFDFYSRTLSGQKEQKSSQKRSIQRINSWVGELLGIIYVDKFFSIESKHAVNGMIDTVLDIMKESLQNNDWLTEETKKSALKKLARFTKKIGFPDKWKDYSSLNIEETDSLYELRKKILAFLTRKEFFEKLNTVKDLTEWHMSPQTVNAYFHPLNNEIVFPAAILQTPFYSSSIGMIDFDYPEPLADVDVCLAANFGGIGAVIAHEITHGFDDQGRKFDENGNLVDWWTQEDTKLFESKTKLMGNQAELYEFKVTDENGKEIVHKMKPQLTMGENLADLGGLSLAKQALLRQLKGKSEDIIKASLEIFFRSWANVWKFNASKETRIQRLATDPHAPADFRGNLVKHIPEFYSVFDVQEGDAMYIPPEQRVAMW